MKFKILKNNEEIECTIVLTFKDKTSGIDYIVYSDGTKDENNELEIYASRYTLEDGNYVLKEIENDYEWDMVDYMLSKKYE